MAADIGSVVAQPADSSAAVAALACMNSRRVSLIRPSLPRIPDRGDLGETPYGLSPRVSKPALGQASPINSRQIAVRATGQR